MNVKEYFFNRQCDVCGALLDEELWHNEVQTLNDVASEADWRHLGGRDYCHDCWNYDDDDNIVTKDGRKFDGDTYERIRNGIDIDELGEKTRLQVTAILAIEKMRTWFDSLPDEEKTNFAKEYPQFVTYKKEE